MLNGTVTDYTSSTESTIKEYPNGWYYVQVTSSTSMSGANANTFYLWASDASSGPIAGTTSTGYFYAWGAQTEAGSFPTSYIPTGGSTVTRAADVASLPVERFAYNQAQGSVVVEAVMPPSVISEQFWILGSNTNSARWFYSNSGDISLNAYDGASTSSASPLQPSATQKMSIGTDQSTKILCLDGVSGNQTNTTGNISSLTTVFYFGGNSSTPVVNFNGHIKHIQYYPKRLSNTELQLLTQPSASPTMNLTFDGQATSTLVEGLHD